MTLRRTLLISTRIITFASAILVSSGVSHASSASHTPTEPVRLWYLGEGVQEQMLVSYRIERNETDIVHRYNLTVSFIGKNENGDWLSNFKINDNATSMETEVVLSESQLHPIRVSNESSLLIPYVDDYIQSIEFLGAFSEKGDPRNLESSSWGGLACEGCPRIRPMGLQTISVPAGTFNVTLIDYAGSFKIWVLDGFPYPIKGWIDDRNSRFSNVGYSFELSEAKVNGVSIPEFGHVSLLIAALGLVTLVSIRANKWHIG